MVFAAKNNRFIAQFTYLMWIMLHIPHPF